MLLMMLAEYAPSVTSLALAATGWTADEVLGASPKVMGTLDQYWAPPRLTVELVPEAQ